MKETLLRIEAPSACFTLVSQQGVIVEAAPMGKRWLGTRTLTVAQWYKRRGACVQYHRERDGWHIYEEKNP